MSDPSQDPNAKRQKTAETTNQSKTSTHASTDEGAQSSLRRGGSNSWTSDDYATAWKLAPIQKLMAATEWNDFLEADGLMYLEMQKRKSKSSNIPDHLFRLALIIFDMIGRVRIDDMYPDEESLQWRLSLHFKDYTAFMVAAQLDPTPDVSTTEQEHRHYRDELTKLCETVYEDLNAGRRNLDLLELLTPGAS